MTGLHELQAHFSANLCDDGETDILDSIFGGRFAPSQRTQIYRNNVYSGLTDVLRGLYPVIERLVGEGFFLYACSEYITRFASTCGDLHAYGSSFSSFLREFEPARGLLYLPDEAQLEWYYHEAYHEADPVCFDFEALSSVSPEEYGALCFTLNPTCRLMQSTYPVVDIWRVNQDNYAGDQTLDLDSGGVNVLLLRKKQEIELHVIDQPDYQILHAMMQGERLDGCLDAAFGIDRNFDLSIFLSKYINNKTIVGFQDRVDGKRDELMRASES